MFKVLLNGDALLGAVLGEPGAQALGIAEAQQKPGGPQRRHRGAIPGARRDRRGASQGGVVVSGTGIRCRPYLAFAYVSYVLRTTRLFKFRMNWRKCASEDGLYTIRAELRNQAGGNGGRPQTVDRFVKIKIATPNQGCTRLSPRLENRERVGEPDFPGCYRR